MSQAAPLYRVPVVIFAVIVGGLYVYAKSGGALFPSRTQVTPASNGSGANAEVAPPRIDFMMGPKSAPAFAAEGQSPFDDDFPVQQSVPAPNPPEYGAPSRTLLPGSKSVIIADPVRVTPAPASPPGTTNVAPRSNLPLQNNPPPASPPAESPRTLFPGSKSAGVVGPSTFTPSNAPPSNAAAQQQAAPRNMPVQQPAQPTSRRSVLPGSKSAPLIDPSTFTPTNAAPTNIGPTNVAPRPPVVREPAVQQRAAPNEYPIQRAAPSRYRQPVPNNNANPRSQGVER